MCEAIENYGFNRHNEGKAEGRAEGKKEIAFRLYRKGYSLTEIAEIADVSENAVRQWLGIDSAQ